MRDERGFDENRLLEGEREIWRNSQWRVTDYALEQLPSDGEYWIDIADIHREMWMAHMSEKNWVDMILFSEALAKARTLFPQKVKAA